MPTLSELWQFISSVFWRWQSWVGGSGGGGAVVVLVALYLQLSGRTMPKRMYVTIFIICFLFFAFFMAWVDQNRLVIATQQKLDALTIPKIKGTLIQTMTITRNKVNDRKTITILLWLTMENTGANSAVGRYSLQAGEADGQRRATEFVGTIRDKFGKPWRDIRVEDNLYDVTRTALERGTPKHGVLAFDFSLEEFNNLPEDTQMTLRFQDYLEKEYEVQFVYTKNGKNEPPIGLPGVGIRPK